MVGLATGPATRTPGSLAHDHVMNCLANGARGRGRPKRLYPADIAEWTGIGISACV